MENTNTRLGKPYKLARVTHISQGYHDDHKALDWVSSYGVPLCAPERVRIEKISGDGYTPLSNGNLLAGYGLTMRGLETGYKHQYWHTLPYLPVWAGDIVEKGQIVAYMGNSGYVLVNGKQVPVEQRLEPHKPGTHLHQVMWSEFGIKVDPLSVIDLDAEPNYSLTDQLSAMGKVLAKIAKLKLR